jgi:hypothetical protein
MINDAAEHPKMQSVNQYKSTFTQLLKSEWKRKLKYI